MSSKDTEAPRLGRRFEAALVYAAQLHVHQQRKGTDVPYIAHLLSVAALVIEDGGDEDEAIAALLHDAVEDQGGKVTLEKIHDLFGERVASVVEGCSDTDQVPKPPWRQRKDEYLQHLRRASPEVRRISVADKLHNARAVLADYRRVGETMWDRFNGGKDGTLWYYRALVEVYQEFGPNTMVEELDRIVSELERHAGTSANPER